MYAKNKKNMENAFIKGSLDQKKFLLGFLQEKNMNAISIDLKESGKQDLIKRYADLYKQEEKITGVIESISNDGVLKISKLEYHTINELHDQVPFPHNEWYTKLARELTIPLEYVNDIAIICNVAIMSGK